MEPPFKPELDMKKYFNVSKDVQDTFLPAESMK